MGDVLDGCDPLLAFLWFPLESASADITMVEVELHW